MTSNVAELVEIQERWIARYADVIKRENPDRARNEFAFPFVSVAPDGYNPDVGPSVLYVGKATKHGWEEQNGDTLDSRRKETIDFLKAESVRPDTDFWRCAKVISDALALSASIPVATFQNLVWTNIAKLGVTKGNPEGKYFDLQRDLAVETLKLEIATYQPALIMFVTADYQTDVLMELTDRYSSWQKDDDNRCWWIEGSAKRPPVLWTEHPQGKRRFWTVWAERACNLISLPQ